MTTLPDTPFVPTTPPPTSPAAVQRPPRKTKAKAVRGAKKREAPLRLVTDADIQAAVKEKKAKKRAKKAKAEKALPATIKISMKEYATMRLGAGAKLFLRAHKLMVDAPAAQRKAVLAELAAVFA